MHRRIINKGSASGLFQKAIFFINPIESSFDYHILINQKYSVRMETYFFIFNLALLSFSFMILSVDIVLYSLIMSYVTSVVLDQVLTIFNQRKMALVAESQND